MGIHYLFLFFNISAQFAFALYRLNWKDSGEACANMSHGKGKLVSIHSEDELTGAVQSIISKLGEQVPGCGSDGGQVVQVWIGLGPAKVSSKHASGHSRLWSLQWKVSCEEI